MPQLDFTTFYSQIFWLALCCIVVFYMVNGAFSTKMNYIFFTRQQTIATNIYEAEQSIALCKQLDSNMKKTLTEAKEKAHSIRQEAWKKSEDFLKAEIVKINIEMDKKEKHALKKLSRYQIQLKTSSLALSDELAQSVIHKLKDLCSVSTNFPN